MIFKKWIIFALLLLANIPINAQNSSYTYLYIEGDKETPFYVKMEGKMMPRLGQNYTILSNLDAGVTNLEILFQQNKYAPLKFAVNIPKGIPRGLMLRKVDDNFALVDLQTGKYIFSGNKASEDNITALENQYTRNRQIATKPVVENKTEVAKVDNTPNETLPEFKPETPKKQPKQQKPKETVAVKEKPQKTQEPKPKVEKPKKETPTVAAKEQPKTKSAKYLDNVVINDDATNEDGEAEEFTTSTPSNTSACQTPISEKDFTSFLEKVKSREGESRIKYVSKNKKLCFTTEQVSYIGRSIPSSSGRLQVLQQLYQQTTDKQNYEMLEHLFKTDFLKNKFKESIPH